MWHTLSCSPYFSSRASHTGHLFRPDLISDIYRIIGVQSFKGSLRRNCYLLPTLGEGPTQLMNAFCGGYVNATTLQPSPYLYLDGLPADMVKGYICPAGQICQVCLALCSSNHIPPSFLVIRKDRIQMTVLKVSIQSGILRFK